MDRNSSRMLKIGKTLNAQKIYLMVAVRISVEEHCVF